MAFPARRLASDSGNDAAGTTTRQAYDTLATGFGAGFNGPITMLADVSKQNSADSTSRAKSPNYASSRPP